ncbi:hypothetical protein [Candidatus Poriferisodalis sp.]|uniref:hypothetical protein n=1 Tax=Candidatus Poriferisodalis sp. TaxID=3101277 RepID=UPI003B01DD6E
MDTLAWILQQCRDEHLDQGELQQRYLAAYSLDSYVALVQIQGLQKYGLLEKERNHLTATAPSVRWLDTGRAEFIIGAMHANLKLVGELIHEVRRPRTRKSLLGAANNLYGFAWQKDSQIAYRLGWLRSAGFARQEPGNTYQATSAGLEFLEHLDLHRPDKAPPSPPKPPPAPPSSSEHPAVECAERLRRLAVDGARHKDFEKAVCDAFEYLGFEAQLRSGPGETDVLVSGVRATAGSGERSADHWRYKAVVDAKAVSKGSLTSGQVTWPAIEKHRDQHQAEYALLVGPSPSGQLLDFAAKARIGVLAAENLADLVTAHTGVPLALMEYHALFVDENGQSRGGIVELEPIDDARTQQARRREVLSAVHQVVTDVVTEGLKADLSAIAVALNMMKGIQASPSEIAAAVDLLASPWLGAIACNEEGAAQSGDFVATAPGSLVAQRLRWLADAFDDETDDAAASAGSG